jgi:UDP-2-acetamido-3-amino-2,3-dideoxy-glucuronate N-acetyltransferase
MEEFHHSEENGYLKIGTNIIHKSFFHGHDFKIGDYCIIEEGCVVGDHVDIQNYVLLKKGTVMGDRCYVDSYFRSSGDNKIGNRCTLRFGSTIARKVFVEDDVFISPNVMTVYSLPDGSKSTGTFIKKGAFIGTASVIGPSITIGEGVIIGTNSYVNRNCPEGVYAGVPAKKIR